MGRFTELNEELDELYEAQDMMPEDNRKLADKDLYVEINAYTFAEYRGEEKSMETGATVKLTFGGGLIPQIVTFDVRSVHQLRNLRATACSTLVELREREEKKLEEMTPEDVRNETPDETPTATLFTVGERGPRFRTLENEPVNIPFSQKQLAQIIEALNAFIGEPFD